MPDFKEQGDIIIQPGDVKVPYSFSLQPASSASANDGAIPYGSHIDSVVVTAHKSDGGVATGLVFSSSESADVITVMLSYPSTDDGTYHLKFVCTLDTDSTVIEFDFNHIKVRDK